jgi:hypothetical protein
VNIWRATFAATFVVGLTVAAPTAAHATGPTPVPAAATGRHSLCAPPPDTVGPVISQVTFRRASIDLNSGSRIQTITATAADSSGRGNPSGVAHVWVGIRGNRFYTGVKLERTSGTAASGDWTGRFVVSKYAHAGTYSIEYLYATDAAGNQQSYTGYGSVPDGPNALSLHPGDDPTFTVTGTPATPPTRKPAGTLHVFTFHPTQVNTTSTVRYVHVIARFAGAVPHRVSVGFASAKRPGLARYVFLSRNLHHQPGIWSGTVQVPRWLGKQALQPYVTAVYGSGYKPEVRSYDADALNRLHFPTRLAVVSGVDKAKPTLRSLRFSPSSIDSTTGAEKVTVTARAGDIGSGVRSIDVSGGIRHGVNGAAGGFYPFASAGVGYLSSNYFQARLEKTSTGTWVGTTTVRQCVPSGTYKLTASVQDIAGNYHYYSTKQLANANITSTVKVTSKHGDVEPPYVYSAATYGADHALFLNFSEGVADVNTDTLTIYPLSPTRSRFTKPATVTAMTCANGTATVDCSGSGGLVTSAELTIPSLTPGVQYAIFANLNQVTAQLVDGNGNPMDWNYEAAQVKDS